MNKSSPIFRLDSSTNCSKRVQIAGVGDKHQLTITAAGTISGFFLPFQVLCRGKNERCHPITAFDVWHTPNHWANEATTFHYIDKISIPYIVRATVDLGLGEEHMALVF